MVCQFGGRGRGTVRALFLITIAVVCVSSGELAWASHFGSCEATIAILGRSQTPTGELALDYVVLDSRCRGASESGDAWWPADLILANRPSMWLAGRVLRIRVSWSGGLTPDGVVTSYNWWVRGPASGWKGLLFEALFGLAPPFLLLAMTAAFWRHERK